MNQRTFNVVIALLVSHAGSAVAATIRVPADQPTIQAGINAAAPIGDTVLVAPGTYTGSGNGREVSLNGRNLALVSEAGNEVTTIDSENVGSWLSVVQGEVALISGFTVRRSDAAVNCMNSSPTISNCVFEDCRTGGLSVLVINGPQAAAIVSDCTFVNNEDDSQGAAAAGADLSTSIFIRCSFIGNTVMHGRGGALVFVGNASASLMECTFSGNSARRGGCIQVESASVDLINCTFSDNWADLEGGCIELGQASVVHMTDCMFTNSGAFAGHGGAIYASSSSVELTRCALMENVTFQGSGAGIYCFGGPVALTACTFWNNTCVGGVGAGVALDSSELSTLANCTFAGNDALLGAGLSLIHGSSVSLSNTIIASNVGDAVFCAGGGNTVSASCSDIYGNAGGNWAGCLAGQLGVNGNFTEDPLFCDATNGDLRISGESPCAPQNSPLGCGLIGANVIGCATASIAASQTPRLSELMVSPNPVRSVAHFETGMDAPFSLLKIFDSKGRLIEHLKRRDGRWEWVPGSSVPSGIYFARPDAADAGTAVKFLYLR